MGPREADGQAMKELNAPFIEQSNRRQASFQSPIRLAITPLQTTASTLLTVKTGFDFIVRHLWVANTTGGAVTYTLHFVPAAGSPATANMAIAARSLGANASEVVAVAVGHRLLPGESIRALCATNSAINMGGWGHYIQGEG